VLSSRGDLGDQILKLHLGGNLDKSRALIKIHYVLIDSFLFLFLQLQYLYTCEAEETFEHENNTNNNPAIDEINSLFALTLNLLAPTRVGASINP